MHANTIFYWFSTSTKKESCTSKKRFKQLNFAEIFTPTKNAAKIFTVFKNQRTPQYSSNTIFSLCIRNIPLHSSLNDSTHFSLLPTHFCLFASERLFARTKKRQPTIFLIVLFISRYRSQADFYCLFWLCVSVKLFAWCSVEEGREQAFFDSV